MDLIKPFQRLLILILTDAGGEGKTMLALLFRALLELAGEQAGFIDADAGNYSAGIQLRETAAANSLKTVRWGASVAAAARILSDHLGSHMIFDTGANTSASEREITKMLPALQEQAKAAGYRTVAIMPVSTNKPGAVGALVELAANYAQWEHVFVRVDRDASRTFEEGLDPALTVDLGNLATGYQQYIRSAKGLPAAITTPPAGFELAADKVADWMAHFAQQSLITQVIGHGPAQALGALGRARPLSTRFAVPRLENVSNGALRQNARRSEQLNILEQRGWSAASHREVIRQLESGLL